jgi:spermidine synthase
MALSGTRPLSALTPASRAGVYFVFTVSGAAALVYQVLWARWLSLVFGNTTASVAIVLASFMLGLALGSRAAGSVVERLRNPMAAYAWLELGIGLFAVAFPFLWKGLDWVYTSVVSASASSAFSLGVRALLSFALLVIPTTLMGATLPLLADFFRRHPSATRSWKVGVLYAANTLGAALGSLAASFLLIELVGVRNTTLLAAGLNGVVALWAFLISRSTEARSDPVPAPAPAPRSATAWLALGTLAASGGLALASEVLWTRTLEILVGNSSYAFSILLVVYLAGLAAGSWAMSLVLARLRDLAVWLAVCQLAMAGWTFAALVLFSALGHFLRRYGFASVSVSTLLSAYLAAGSILFPLAFFSGAVFPLATRILDPNAEDAAGSRIATAYSWNTLGAVAGSLVAGFLVAPRMDYFQSVHFLSFLYACCALAIVWVAVRGRTAGTRGPLAALAVLAIVIGGTGLQRATDPDAYARRWKRGGRDSAVLFHKPGLQGVTTVLRTGDELQLLVNGTGMTRKVTATKMMAHLPLLLHPDPVDTLVICFGMGTTYRSAITHGGNVTAVELVAEVFEAFPHFYADSEKILRYPKGRLVVNDGRNFLKLARKRFDVITIDPPPPIDAAGVNNLYSKEFLELARDHLKKGGIMAHWLPGPGSHSGVNDWGTFFMLLRTFTEVFPETLVIPSLPLDQSVGAHVLGSMEPLYPSRDRIARRLERDDVARDVSEWDRVGLDYFLRLEPPTGDVVQSAAVNTDDRPLLEFDLLRAWREGVKKTYPLVWW